MIPAAWMQAGWVVALVWSAAELDDEEPLLRRGLTIPVAVIASQPPTDPDAEKREAEQAEKEKKSAESDKEDGEKEKAATKPRYIPRAAAIADADKELKQLYAVDWAMLVELSRASGIEVKIAEGKFQESVAGIGLAQSSWLPELRVGVSWLHHDGYIQDIPGQVINANKNSLFAGPLVRLKIDPAVYSRDVLQAKQLARVRRAQVRRASQTQFQSAALAYIDLQTAQAGAAISLEAMVLIESIIERADNIERAGFLAPLQTRPYATAKATQLLTIEKLRQQHRAAGRKLSDLLDLEDGACLYAASEEAPLLRLTDIDRPLGTLLAEAMSNGPGVEEIAAAQQALDEQLENARRHKFTPNIAVDLGYGAFGGGVGSRYNSWSDRFDAGAHVYWDVSELFRADSARKVFEAKKQGVCLEREKLRKSLTLGVVVAYEQAHASRKRLTDAQQQVANAIDTYNKIRDLKVIPSKLGGSTGIKDDGDSDPTGMKQVVEQYGREAKAIEQLAQMRSAYLEALVDWNKAQAILHFLTGGCEQSVGGMSGSALPAPSHPTSKKPTVEEKGTEEKDKGGDKKANEPAAEDKQADADANPRIEARPVRGKRSSRPTRSKGPFPKLSVDDRGS